jgi:hypothetical protein
MLAALKMTKELITSKEKLFCPKKTTSCQPLESISIILSLLAGHVAGGEGLTPLPKYALTCGLYR